MVPSLRSLATCNISAESKVLLLWSSKCNPVNVKETAEQLNQKNLQVENIDRLQMGLLTGC